MKRVIAIEGFFFFFWFNFPTGKLEKVMEINISSCLCLNIFIPRIKCVPWIRKTKIRGQSSFTFKGGSAWIPGIFGDSRPWSGSSAFQREIFCVPPGRDLFPGILNPPRDGDSGTALGGAFPSGKKMVKI